MSLVDYEDSDDDVLEASKEEEDRNQKKRIQQPQQKPSPKIQRCEQEESVELPQLPDALFLLESPTITQRSGYDHASVVAAAMAENALRKRDLNGNPSSLPRRSKLPRGNLPHSRNIPETVGNLLVPPQLKGRSNVATEDMSKLFVKKQQETPKARSPTQE